MKKKLKYLLLLLLLCGVTVVSAMLIKSLSIVGTGTLGKNTWKVNFTNLRVTEGSEDGNVEMVDNTVITFNADLNEPGDYFEFKIDVVNNGSMDAMVNNFILSDLGELSKLINYIVTYEDGMEISKKDKLSVDDTETILVRIEYRTDVSADDLNTEDLSMNFSFDLDYVKDEGTGILRYNSLVGKLVNNVKDSNDLVFNRTISSGEEGVYKLNNIHFFRGGVINNNVVIDDNCYYAIRTTNEGNLKLLYNGKYIEGTCNSDNVFIDNVVWNEDDTKVTYEDSNIRSVLTNWYSTNLSKYDNAIVGGYCNDLSMKGERYYNYVKFENGIVDLNCSNVIDDKIGLLNVDEILMVGYGRNGTYKSYLDANAAYYSMSTYSNSKVVVVNQYAAKNLSSVNKELGVRPVITIKANTGVIDGDGSKENPYIASLKV